MNIVNLVITWICLVFMAILSFIVLIKIFFLKRAERIDFLRSFKRGKCAIIYFAVLPLYIIGRIYAGENLAYAFFNSVHNVVKLVVLQFDLGSVKLLIESNKFYAYTLYFSYVLVIINAILFSLSLIGQRIWKFFSDLHFFYSKKDKLVVVGKNPHSIEIYKSYSGLKVLIDELSEKDCNELYSKNVKYVDLRAISDIDSWLNSHFNKNKSKVYIIINLGSDEKNIAVSREVIKFIVSCNNDELLFNFGAYVFGDPKYENIYTSLVSKSNGCLHYINKYQLIAIDYIDKYPLSLFIDKKYIDYQTATVSREMDINVCLIGFGKTNQQILLSSVANNQFIQKCKQGVEIKQVNYHIFDKEYAQNDKNLNHSYYRFKNEYQNNDKNVIIPQPDLPSKETYYHLDINETDYYKELKSIFVKNEKSANYVIIAFGSDLENVDMARKLAEKRKDWNLPNLNIFVKVRDKKLYESAEMVFDNSNFKTYYLEDQEAIFTKDKDVCYIFAMENDVIYNFNKIVSEKFDNMAKMRSQVYDVEYVVTKNKLKFVPNDLIEKKTKENILFWYKEKTQIERDSNLYAVLSIRSKLNLIGLDICEKSSKKVGLSFEEYMSVYAKNDMPNYEYYNVKIANKPVIFYPYNFPDSLRRNLAIHEHLRWNSYMISKGMVLSSDEQILEEMVEFSDGKVKHTNGKNYEFRRHGNITTFEGIIKFAEIIAERDKTTLEDTDVFKYDYQLLDDAFWLLDENGYKIVKR